MKKNSFGMLHTKELTQQNDFSHSSLLIDQIAKIFFEVASEQRLNIIQRLNKKGYKIAEMAKELKDFPQQVSRNFSRLTKAGIIEIDINRLYHLTLFGRIVYKQISLLAFMKKNMNYFKSHNFGDMPSKLVYRIGDIEDSQMISGHANILKFRHKIYKNAGKYIIHNTEDDDYSLEIVDLLATKLQNNVKIQSIFSCFDQSYNNRFKTVQEKNLRKFIDDGLFEQKIKKSRGTVIISNEKEAGIIFPSNNDDEPDYNRMLYSTNSIFNEWCSDYFSYMWNNSKKL